MLALVLSVGLLGTSPDPETSATPALYELRHDVKVDGAITGALWASWLATEAVFKHSLSPPVCRWCEANALDTWARGIRTGPEWLLTMDMASNVVGFGLLPVSLLGLDLYFASSHGSTPTAAIDALLILQATGAALVFNQVVKFSVGRERPFVSALSPEEKAAVRDPADNNLSFFSGHSTFAFAVTVAAGRVAQLRGYRRAWLVWAVGLPLAVSVPLLRMASDRHYLTDVLVGSAVGATFGYALPTLFHHRTGALSQLTVAPAPNGVSVSGVF